MSTPTTAAFKIQKIEAIRPQMIKVKDIQMPIYQRRLDYSRARRIADSFDSRLLGTLLISHRHGQYFIVDGQHRLVALRIRGIADAPCVVMTGLTDQKEAELFREYNMQRKPLDRSDLLAAKLAAYDKAAIDMVERIQKAGFTCSTRPQPAKHRNRINITAVAAVERAYKQLRGETFTEMMELIADVWPQNKEAVCASMLNGLSCFVNTYKDDGLDYCLLRDVLEETTPFKVMAKANTLCESVNNRNLRTPIAQTILKMYNSSASSVGKKLKIKNF